MTAFERIEALEKAVADLKAAAPVTDQSAAIADVNAKADGIRADLGTPTVEA